MAGRLKPSEMVAELQRLQEQVTGLTESIERIVARLDALESGSASSKGEGGKT